MNNIKIMGYEIRRIVLSKRYFYMLLVLGIWTYDILTRLIIDGTGGTAPFSKYNYASFSSLLNPMLLSILLLIGLSIFSEKEAAVRRIIFSTPIKESRYFLIKGLSVLFISIMTTLLPVFMSYIFFGHCFHYYRYLDFIYPFAIFVIPSIILVLGLLMFLGKLNSKVLYILLPIVFFGGLINLGLPSYFDISGNNLFINYIAQDIAGEKGFDFMLPQEFTCSRVVFIVLGMIVFNIGCKVKVKED